MNVQQSSQSSLNDVMRMQYAVTNTAPKCHYITDSSVLFMMNKMCHLVASVATQKSTEKKSKHLRSSGNKQAIYFFGSTEWEKDKWKSNTLFEWL